MIKNIILIFCFIIISACGLTTTRPKLEMSYAQAAFLAAKEAKAEKPAKGYKDLFQYLKEVMMP